MMNSATKYGLVVFAAIFFVGWSTGMGGLFWPNLIFSILMGVLAGLCFLLVQKFAGRSGATSDDGK
jgi:hypothetical protein